MLRRRQNPVEGGIPGRGVRSVPAELGYSQGFPTRYYQSSVGRQALAKFRIEEVRLIDGEREPDRFVFTDSQPLLKNGHDLRLTRVRDQMRFRTRRFDEGDDAGKSSVGSSRMAHIRCVAPRRLRSTARPATCERSSCFSDILEDWEHRPLARDRSRRCFDAV